MLTIKKILVPVDLTQNTSILVEYALGIASSLEAEVILFHAVEFMTFGEMDLGNPSYDDYDTIRKEAANTMMDTLITDAGQKYEKINSIAVIGDIVDEIIDHTISEKADLIIIGTHGKRGLEKIMLGSVADRVLKNAHCPVLVMNPYRR